MGTSNLKGLNVDVAEHFVNNNFSLIQSHYKTAATTLKSTC
jgi:hypothetical protein